MILGKEEERDGRTRKIRTFKQEEVSDAKRDTRCMWKSLGEG